MNSLFQRPDIITEPLHVITTVFNSPRYRSRWKLYEDFEKRVLEAGAKLTTVEVAFGDRFGAIQPADNNLVLLRTSHELWHKERALNIGVSRLPADWKYVAWIDADISFIRDDWANEAVHMLQHYPVIQMWRTATDLNADHEPMAQYQSFAWVNERGFPTKITSGSGGSYYFPSASTATPYPHPGYAWAMRRDAWEQLGGLIDVSVLGAADWHMAHALLGQVEWTLSPGYTNGYKKVLREWQARAEKYIQRNLGSMKGGVVHYWHGHKAERRYMARPEVLIRNRFDPHLDLKPDWQGLYQLTDRNPRLRDDLRRYFHERNEDA
jgi:glycosyltransferase involved in cell wall biosynthesis